MSHEGQILYLSILSLCHTKVEASCTSAVFVASLISYLLLLEIVLSRRVMRVTQIQ